MLQKGPEQKLNSIFLRDTHPGVKIGLQAGSSCCVNLESAIKLKIKYQQQQSAYHVAKRIDLTLMRHNRITEHPLKQKYRTPCHKNEASEWLAFKIIIM